MKKILGILLVVIFLAVGCGNTKKLECKIDVSGIEQTMTFEYDGEDIKNVEMVMLYSADALKEEGINEDNIAEYAQMTGDAFCTTYAGYEGIDCYSKADKGTIKLILEIKYSKLSEDTKNTFGMTNDSYNDIKKEFEEDGYTCK